MMIDYAKEVTSQTEEELETAEGSKIVFYKKGNGEILNRAILYAIMGVEIMKKIRFCWR